MYRVNESASTPDATATTDTPATRAESQRETPARSARPVSSGIKTLLVAAAFAGTTPGALAQNTVYRGKWTFTQNVASAANDLHIKIDIHPEPAVRGGPVKFIKGPFNNADSTGTPFSPDFTANWYNPDANIPMGATVTVGFEFDTNKSYTVTDAYWTFTTSDGTSHRIGDIPVAQVPFKKKGRNDNFDEYFPGQLPPQSQWEPWFDDPLAGNFQVVPGPAFSPPHSLLIQGPDDAVLRYDDLDFENGQWLHTCWQFIPAGYHNDPQGGHVFGLLDQYDPNGPVHYGTHMQIDGNSGLLGIAAGELNQTIQVPYIVDQWVPIDTVVDLENDHVQVFYNQQPVCEYQWTAGAFGDGNGVPSIAAIDLWGNGSAGVFYDDMQLVDITPDCHGDLDGDGTIGFADLLFVLAAWGPCGECPEDLDGNGEVGFPDLLTILANWGGCA